MRRTVQLVLALVVLGLGVGLVLLAGLGSDGYSSLVSGLSRAMDLPFSVVNAALGLALVVAAWLRGVVPGPGTLAQPLVVGSSVQVVLLATAPEGIPARIALLALGLPVLALGVVGYLVVEAGAGPAEGAALAMRPLPFRWAYTVLQVAGAVTGWLLGADVGPGTLVVALGVGPLVDLLRPRLPGLVPPAVRGVT